MNLSVVYEIVETSFIYHTLHVITEKKHWCRNQMSPYK